MIKTKVKLRVSKYHI